MIKMTIKHISYLFIIWIVTIITILTLLITHEKDKSKLKFYTFGPSDELIIMGIVINTQFKYYLIVLFTFINSSIRAISHNYINPWIINNIQNDIVDKNKLSKQIVYQISIINTIYTWIDWLLYMNILLAQIDMLLYEIISEIIVSTLLNRYYMKIKSTKENDNADDTLLDNIV
jgi:hypothetical protein